MAIDGISSSGMQYSKRVERSNEPTAPEAKSVEDQQAKAKVERPSQNDGMKSLGVGGTLDLQG